MNAPGLHAQLGSAAGVALGVLSARLRDDFRPLILGWEVTTACNAACVYCGFRKRSPDELTPDEALRLVAEMRGCGTRMVGLSGGEALLRPDVDAIVDALVDQGIAVSLNTNGHFVHKHERAIRRLRRVQVSVDGPEAVHDALRGAGTWRRAVDGIERCLAWGVNVSVEAVLSRTSLPHLEALLAWCRERRLKLQVQPADPTILNTQQPDPEAPDQDALREALARLRALRPGEQIANTRAGLDHLWNFPTPTPMRCASGKISARVGSDGMMRLCGVPPAHAPVASWREHGLAGAFARLHPVECAQCWCAPRVDVNLGFQGRGLVDLTLRRARGTLLGR